MSQLSRGAFLGGAVEATAGTYLPPTFTIPFNKADFETVQAPLRDESVRNSDNVLQGLYAGTQESAWQIDVDGYPDLVGYFLRMLGPDTVTAGVSTTLSGSTLAGATSITTAATIPVGSTIKIGSGALVEYAVTGTPSGAGPYTIPITKPATGLLYAHNSADPVLTPTTHKFAQSLTTRPPSWSFSVWDTVAYLGFPGCKLSELQLKIDPKAALSLSAKATGYPEQSVTTFTPAFTATQPLLGWQWTMTDGGASSTRGLTLDLTLKRAVDAIHASNGVQAPREVFAGALEIDGTYKVTHEGAVDMNLFLQYSQQPMVAALTKPYNLGGESLTITMSQGGVPKGKRDLSPTYVEASYDISAIANNTDAGIATATLSNWVTTAY